MKKYLFTCVLVFAVYITKAQTATADTTIYTAVSSPGGFTGGIAQFTEYLKQEVKYPEAAKQAGIQGKVFLTFIIEKDGSLSNVKVIRGVNAELDAEAVRVIKASPKWIPGKQDDKPVRMRYTVPIAFTLTKQ